MNRDKDPGPLLLAAAVFISGVILGVIGLRVLSPDDKAELASYLEIFVRGLGTATLEPATLFRLSLSQNLKTAFFLWLLGLAVIGAPFCWLLMAVRGFAFGFSSAFLIKEVSGVSLFIRGVLPHTIVFVPGLLLLGALSTSFSASLIKDRPWAHGGLLPKVFTYTAKFSLFSLFLVGASLIEAYLCPFLLLKLVSL